MNRFVCLLLIFLFLACSVPKNRQVPEEEYVPSDRLQRIVLSDLQGNPVRLSDFAGKAVFLNFWATWCGPCIGEMGSIEALYEQFKKEEIVFLAASNEPAEKIHAFREGHPFSFTYVRLEVDYIDAFIVKLPTTLLIDAEGVIRHEEEGATIWTLYNNVERIKQLLPR